MDEFEQKINELNELSTEEKKEQLNKMAMDCICPIVHPTMIALKKKKNGFFVLMDLLMDVLIEKRAVPVHNVPLPKNIKLE